MDIKKVVCTKCRKVVRYKIKDIFKVFEHECKNDVQEFVVCSNCKSHINL